MCYLIHPSEAYHLAKQTLDHYRGTIVACRYCPPPSLTRPESLETLKSKFYDAIARVVLAQPHLQVGLTGENSKKPAFVRLGCLDFRNHVDWKSFDDSSHAETFYLELMQIQLDSKFDHLSDPAWLESDYTAQNRSRVYASVVCLESHASRWNERQNVSSTFATKSKRKLRPEQGTHT